MSAGSASGKPTREEAAAQTQERVLGAAVKLFGENGYKGVSIAQIAREAGVAKGTIYIYYASKKELFYAICEHMFAQFLGAVDDVIADPSIPPVEKPGRAVLAKFGFFHDFVHGSEHSADLLAEADEVTEELVATADARMIELLAQAIDEATALGQMDPASHGHTSHRVAHLVFQAACGISTALDPEAYARDVLDVSDAICRGYAPRS